MTDISPGTTPLPVDEIVRLEELLTGEDHLPKFFAAVGTSSPVVGALSFGFGILTRFLALRGRIDEAIAASGETLRGRILAQGIFRPPVTAGSGVQRVLLYFRRETGEAARRYPTAYEQLEPTISDVIRGGPESTAGLQRLLTAACLLPLVYSEGTATSEDSVRPDYRERIREAIATAPDAGPLEDTLLDVVIAETADDGPTDFPALCDRMRMFVDGAVFTGDDLRDLLPSYSRIQLRRAESAIDAAERTELARLRQTIDDLVWATVLGSDGITEKAIEFVVDRETFRLEERRDALTEEIERLEAIPDAQRTEAQEEAIAAKQLEIESIGDRLEEIADPGFAGDGS